MGLLAPCAFLVIIRHYYHNVRGLRATPKDIPYLASLRSKALLNGLSIHLSSVCN